MSPMEVPALLVVKEAGPSIIGRNWLTKMLNKNTLGVKKVRGQSEAALQIGVCNQKL